MHVAILAQPTLFEDSFTLRMSFASPKSGVCIHPSPSLLTFTPHFMHASGEPKLRDTIFVHNAANKTANNDYEHYFGQKGVPMFWKLATYSYENMIIPDKPHNLARLTTWIMKLLVGPHGKGSSPLTVTPHFHPSSSPPLCSCLCNVCVCRF